MKSRKIAVIAIVLILLIGSVYAAATMFYLLNKRASLTISVNSCEIELYTQETNPATTISNITFPSMMLGSPSNKSRTDVMYLFAKRTAQNYALKWICPNLPTGPMVKAYWNLAGDLFYQWTENTTINVDLVMPNSGFTGMRLYFEAEANTNNLQNYIFDINILAGV